MNYSELGLKVGLEIHQQLDTKKLFCNCPSKLVESNEVKAIRELHAVKSEIGEIDVAALEEERKGKKFKYIAPLEASCLVELDEEPPHEVNEEALEVALTVALMLNAKIIDEIHFMRKIVIDGSNPSGFQRTALIAVEGNVKNVRVKTICLEEEAARKVSDDEEYVIYNLDRMGIPLIEIATYPDISDPYQAREIAEKIGLILRSTKKVKRGIGTIRQDLNISIKDGARVEVKGVQELDLIPKIIENEVKRQLHLINLKKELNKRLKKDEIKFEPRDVSIAFKNTSSKFIKRTLSSGQKAYAIRLPKMAGLLSMGGEYRLGRELSSYVKVKVGLKGILHSDELPNYGISEEDVKKVRELLEASKNDAFVLVIAEETKAIEALKVVYERVLMAFDGVPEEVRRALPDGNTEYMRPLPGAARMYPETDVPPIRVSEEYIKELKTKLPEKFEDKVMRFVKEYSISQDHAKIIVRRGFDDIFEAAVKMGVSPNIVVKTLLSTLEEIKKEVGSIENITNDVILETFRGLSRGLFSKEAIPEILKYVAQKGYRPIEEICEELGLKLLSEEELRGIIRQNVDALRDVIKDRGLRAINVVMGKVMSVVRGKADGKLVSKLVQEEIKRIIGET